MANLQFISILILLFMLGIVQATLYNTYLNVQYQIHSSFRSDQCKASKMCDGVQQAFDFLVRSDEHLSFISSLNDGNNSVGVVNITFVIMMSTNDFCGFNFSVADSVASYEMNFVSSSSMGTNMELSCSGLNNFLISEPKSLSSIGFHGCNLRNVNVRVGFPLSFTFVNSNIEVSSIVVINNGNSLFPTLRISGCNISQTNIGVCGNSEIEHLSATNSMIKLNNGKYALLSSISFFGDSWFQTDQILKVYISSVLFSGYGKIFCNNFVETRLSNSIFRTLVVRTPTIYLNSGTYVSIDSIDSFSVPQLIVIELVESVSVSNINIIQSKITPLCIHKSPVSIQDCDNVTIKDSQFRNNKGVNGGALHIDNYVRIYLDNNTFAGNTGDIGGAVLIGNCQLLGIFESSNVFLNNNHFENNTSSQEGGALHVVFNNGIQFSHNTFLQNRAALAGGAIHIGYGGGIIENSLFEGNTVFGNVSNYVRVADTLKGYGGSISCFASMKLNIQNSTFSNNFATNGGAIFASLDEYTTIQGCVFTNNVALLLGDIGYFHTPVGIKNPYLPREKCSSSPSIFSLIGYDQKKIYPGEPISIQILAQDHFGQELGVNKLRIKYDVDTDIVLGFDTNNEQHDILLVSPYPISEPSFDTTRERSITLFSEESNYSFKVLFTFKGCPSRFVLTKEEVNGAIALKCERSNSLNITEVIEIAIPVSVVVLIIGIIIGLVSIYIVKCISVQIWTLKKKQKAELSLEMRIIDKKVIFQQEPEDEYTQNTPKSTRGKKVGDLSVPLLDINDRPSFIIPIENIEIVKKLAEGGLGIIYLGKLWKKLDVAIKLLKSDEQSEEFEKEASLLSSLRHDNILIFYGICMTSESKYMITEFAELGSLDKALYRSRIGECKLSLSRKLSILIATAKGIEYLHNLTPTVVHRDLKPGNILLDGKHGAKICDFGLSRTVSNCDMKSVMTTNLGTLFYCPSEIIEGPTESNMASKLTATKIDVYSFSIIMWEVFFELIPYSKSVKLTQLYPTSAQDDQPWDNLSTFNIPSLVVKGFRPTIPFRTIEQIREWISEYMPEELVNTQTRPNIALFIQQYFAIVETNWNHNATLRSSISTIRSQLEELQSLLQVHRDEEE